MNKEERIQRALGTLPAWRVEVKITERLRTTEILEPNEVVWPEFITVEALNIKIAGKRGVRGVKERTVERTKKMLMRGEIVDEVLKYKLINVINVKKGYRKAH